MAVRTCCTAGTPSLVVPPPQTDYEPAPTHMGPQSLHTQHSELRPSQRLLLESCCTSIAITNLTLIGHSPVMLAGLTWTAETGINQRNLKGSRSADRDEVCEEKTLKLTTRTGGGGFFLLFSDITLLMCLQLRSQSRTRITFVKT